MSSDPDDHPAELSAGPDQEPDERAWAADRRDFVADRRDQIADEREARADEREARADEREARLDRRESAPGQQDDSDPTSLARRARATAQAEERAERERERIARLDAGELRAEATVRRETTTAATGLALAFAEIAAYLHASDDVDAVLDRIVRTAVTVIDGADVSSVTARGPDGYRTLASTGSAAEAVDQAQYDADEGPCLDALEQPVVRASSLPDPRWPALGAGPADAGVHSALSYRLRGLSDQREATDTGSLNNYGTHTDAFDDEAVELGFLLAAHASVALGSTQRYAAADQLSAQLRTALESRDVIGQAKGILMERLHITPEDAFDLLRRASQRLNIKLREVAAHVAESGDFDAELASRPDPS